MGRQKKWAVSSANDLLQKIVRCKSSSDQGLQALQCQSQYPKPARYQLTLSTIRQRNQGRCKLLRRNSAAFRVSTGRRAVSSSEVNCQVPAAYRAEFRRTVCMATQQPGLKSGRLCCLGSSVAERVSQIAFQFPTWTIPRTECAPAGRVLTNRSSTSPLISGVTD